MSTWILGLSAFYHDSAACLVHDGQIIAAAQEERFTRKKHDASFPAQAIAYCLKEGGISVKELNYAAYYEKPFLKFERLLLTDLTCAPRGLRSYLMAMPQWIKEKIFLKDILREHLSYDGEIIFTEHHEAHAASAFYPSPYTSAAVLTIDGVGEWTTSSVGVGEGNVLELLAETRFPHSLGLLYSAFTYYVGFRVNSGEYKLMGLAPYGEPKYVELIKSELIDIKPDGSFKLNLKYFDYAVGLTMTNDRFHKLFGGPPRRPESKLTARDADLARSIQDVTEEIMLKMAGHLYTLTGKDCLCLAGGVALNCVGNGRILREGPFKKIWIQPAAGDAGGALGAALFTWYRYLGAPRGGDETHDLQRGSYLGPEFKDNEVEEFLRPSQAVFEKFSDDALARKIAELIDQQNVVGLCRGRMEYGPRALGARSIIADARSVQMQSDLNLKTKFRESFRPFAPSVLEEKCAEYFDLDAESPYMLLVAPVKPEKLSPPLTPPQRGGEMQGRQNATPPPGGGTRGGEEIMERLKNRRSVIPAVTHVDYSARVQTVNRDTNPFYHQILTEFARRTGCPVVINTSFNIRGEPIVCTPQDAYRCFMCSNMDYLVIGNCLLDKKKQPHPEKYKKEDISQVLD